VPVLGGVAGVVEHTMWCRRHGTRSIAHAVLFVIPFHLGFVRKWKVRSSEAAQQAHLDSPVNGKVNQTGQMVFPAFERHRCQRRYRAAACALVP
jgi:hypothetical protein